MEFTSYTEKTLGNNFNNGNEKQTRLGVGLVGIAVEVVKLCREKLLTHTYQMKNDFKYEMKLILCHDFQYF